MPTVSDMAAVNIDSHRPDPALIEQAALLLNSGELVVAPTETRYGLLARADSSVSLKRVYEAKGRVPLQPTAIFVRELSSLTHLAELPASGRKLAERFLPGPLTLVLKARTNLPEPVVVAGKIGIRWSSSPVIDGLLAKINFPITATSANLSGSPDLATVNEIETIFGEKVALYLDAGPLRGVTSTVVDCTEAEIRILRHGAISAEQLQAALEHEKRV